LLGPACSNDLFGYISCLVSHGVSNGKFDPSLVGQTKSFKISELQQQQQQQPLLTKKIKQACASRNITDLKKLLKKFEYEWPHTKDNGCTLLQIVLRYHDAKMTDHRRWFYRWSEMEKNC